MTKKEFFKKYDTEVVWLVIYLIYFLISELHIWEAMRPYYWILFVPLFIGYSLGYLIFWAFKHNKYRLYWKFYLCFLIYNVLMQIISPYRDYLLNNEVFYRTIFGGFIGGFFIQVARTREEEGDS